MIEILRPEEVLPFFVEFDVDERVVFAAAISSGLRKGEPCGLQKKDLDIPRFLLVARHSYARPFPKSKKQRVVRIPETYASVLLMFGANLTSVHKRLGHSDPKITERRYGHLLPDFMKSEVDRLRFGLDRLAPKLPASGAGESASGSDSQEFAAVPGRPGTPVVRTGSTTQEEAGTPSALALEIPASLLAGCRGLEPLASGVTGRRYNRLN